MTQALYRRWRPQTFDEVVGQEHVVRTLRNALTTGRVHHAYLFAGPRGTGKTTTARLLAKAVNCLAEDLADRPCNQCAMCQAINEGRMMDLIEIDGASNTGVDDVRELRERVGYRPNEGRYKVYVIDEVHMLTTNAFNALLKTLEEPPPHVIFVLATTEPHKILPTILSRCQRFDFRRIPLAAITARLQHLADQEGIQIEPEALTLIARQATGSMRDAESLLDQLAAYTDGGITVEVVRTALGTGDEEAVMRLADALAAHDVGEGLRVINEAVDRGADPRQFARQMVDHLRGLLLTRLGSEATPLHVPDSLQEDFRSQVSRIDPRSLAKAVRLFSQAAVEARSTWQPQLPLELAFVEAAMPEEAASRPEAGEAAPSTPPPRPAPPKPAPSRTPEPSPLTASPPEPSSAPEQEERPAGEGPSLERVQACWSDVLGAIRPHNLSLEALLRSGKPVGVEGTAVLIGFTHKFHKRKVEKAETRRMVEDVLGKLLDQQVQVRCVLTRKSRRQSPSSPPPSSSPEKEEDRLVQAAVEKLGAQVVNS